MTVRFAIALATVWIVAAGCGGTPDRATGGTAADHAPVTSADGSDAGVSANASHAGVRCGDTTCDVGAVCCGGGAGTCASSTDACFARAPDGSLRGSAVSCDGSEDCSGEAVCCVFTDAMAGAGAECMPRAHCTAYGGGLACHEGDRCTAGACAPIDPAGNTFPSTLRTCR